MEQNCCGETLLALGTATAVSLARGLSPDEMATLGSFLNIIGDQLSLLSLTHAQQCEPPCTAKNTGAGQNNC